MERLPTALIERIYSFYNPNKEIYTKVLMEMKQKAYYKALIRQFKQYSVYDRERNFLRFHKYSILTSATL